MSRNVDVRSDVTGGPTITREDFDTSTTVSMNESESEVEEEDDDDIRSLIKQPPKPNWFPVQEIMKRQLGYRLNSQSSILFQRRCYGSLHCAKRLQLFRKLEKHRGCVNCLNFHHDGSMLASGSDDLQIIIWDWKRGKPLISFDSKHKENVFQCKFLPLSGDLHIVSCARDGQVRKIAKLLLNSFKPYSLSPPFPLFATEKGVISKKRRSTYVFASVYPLYELCLDPPLLQ